MNAERRVTAAIGRVKKAARDDDGDSDPAVAETRRVLREAGPDAARLLRHAIRTDGFTSSFQRIRAALGVLRYGGFGPETRVFGASEEDDGDDDGSEGEAG